MRYNFGGEYMENSFDRLMARLAKYERTHKKTLLPEHKKLIMENYDSLTEELENEADFSLWEKEDSIHITITAKALLTCDEAHSLNFLIGIANFTEIEIVDNRIVIRLWFRCWEWIENQINYDSGGDGR